MSGANTPAVVNNTEAKQFELQTDAGLAVLGYTPRGNRLDLVHTEVPPADEGKGYGSQLVEAALDFARSHDKKIIPSCKFVAAYMERHPEYASLVAE